MNTNETTKPPQVGGSALNVQLETANAQIGISAGADFENNMWTFELPAGFKAGAGEYMIVRVVPNAIITGRGDAN